MCFDVEGLRCSKTELSAATGIRKATFRNPNGVDLPYTSQSQEEYFVQFDFRAEFHRPRRPGKNLNLHTMPVSIFSRSVYFSRKGDIGSVQLRTNDVLADIEQGEVSAERTVDCSIRYKASRRLR